MSYTEERQVRALETIARELHGIGKTLEQFEKHFAPTNLLTSEAETRPIDPDCNNCPDRERCGDQRVCYQLSGLLDRRGGGNG